MALVNMSYIKNHRYRSLVYLAFCFSMLLAKVSWAQDTLSLDHAIFKYQNNLALIEVYYACPYRVFNYQVINDTIQARYQLIFLRKNLNSPIAYVDTSYHRIILPSFQKAQSQDLRLVDGLGFFAPAGKYLIALTMQESLFSITVSDTIDVPDFQNIPSLSSIEMASNVFKDTTKGKFTKGNLRIVPNPDRRFGGAYELLYVYLEGYNLVADSKPYQLVYQILNPDKSVIKSYPAEIKNKNGTDFAYTFAISTKGLSSQNYLLAVTLTDLSNNQSVTMTKPFTIITPAVMETPSTFIDTSPLYKEIQFLATPSELNQYQSLTQEGKKEFLRRFWTKHDFNNYTQRIEYVDSKYKRGNTLGRNTDRGRIYIKYGAPDEIVAHTMIEHTRPHEHWYYYAQGIHFIFIDIHSNSNYRLVYSSIDAESKHPNWENLVDPLELDDLK